MSQPDTICAACGLPGHRYGRNEGMDRYDPMACINSLRAVIEDLRAGRLVSPSALVVERDENGLWPEPLFVDAARRLDDSEGAGLWLTMITKCCDALAASQRET